MNSASLPFLIAVGAISAATIAGLFSFLGLVLARQQKISEFRRDWIEGLRGDLAEFCGALASLSSSHAALKDSAGEEEFFKTTGPTRMQWQAAFSRIELRLDPNDPAHKRVLDALKAAASGEGADDGPEGSIAQLPALRERGRELLYLEWKDVRRGELPFRIVQGAMLALFAGGIVAAALYAPRIGPSTSVPLDGEADAARAEERARVNVVHSLQNRFKLDDAFSDELIASGTSAEEARMRVLDRLSCKPHRAVEPKSGYNVRRRKPKVATAPLGPAGCAPCACKRCGGETKTNNDSRGGQP